MMLKSILISIIFYTLSIFNVCSSIRSYQVVITKMISPPYKSNLKYLKKVNHKYPREARLLYDKQLTKRLKTLLKNRYDFLIKTWGPETPIEVNESTFIAWGCQQHNCSNTNFTIVVDFAKNVVYVGIREEENVRIYSEDGSSNKEILKWANRN